VSEIDRINAKAAELEQSRAEEEGRSLDEARRLREAKVDEAHRAAEIRDLCRRFVAWATMNAVSPEALVVREHKRRWVRLDSKLVRRNHPGWTLGFRTWTDGSVDDQSDMKATLFVDTSGEISAEPRTAWGGSLLQEELHSVWGPLSPPPDSVVALFTISSVEESIAVHVARTGKPWSG
jgi:hypothetical protein